MTDALLVRDLSVRFRLPGGELRAVERVNLDVRRGECLGLVGESGSGKSQLVLAWVGLLAANGVASGSVRLGNIDLLACAPRELTAIRGREIGFVFQDPATSLTPHLRVGEQLEEVLRFHRGLRGDDAMRQASAMLEQVRIADAPRRMRQYPHELSGGLRQRVMLALALAGNPGFLVADEPTSALDVTVQAELLDLLRELRATSQLGIVLITHDLAVVAELADRVAVMYAGRIVEEGSASQVLNSPCHPYTGALLSATLSLTGSVDRELAAIAGQPPDLREPVTGCCFAPRCPAAAGHCTTHAPTAVVQPAGTMVACHYPLRPASRPGLRPGAVT